MKRFNLLFIVFSIILLSATCGEEPSASVAGAQGSELNDSNGENKSSNNNSKRGKTSRTSISGTISNGDGQKLFINRVENGRGVKIDTITIGENGEFSHTLNRPLAMDYYIVNSSNRKQFYLITDSTENITLTADYSSFDTPEQITGSPNTEVYQKILKLGMGYDQQLSELDKEMIKASSIKEKKNIGSQKKNIRGQMENDLKEIVQNNQDNLGIAAAFRIMDANQNPELSKLVINSLAKTASGTATYTDIASYVQTSLQPDLTKGKVAPNIEDKDPNGAVKSLYKMRGNVVLVDFWASWCGPCRRENPNLIKAYNKYHEEGFDIMSVSLDSDKTKWVKAIETDKLVWENHVCDFKKWQTPYTDSYGFSSIPHAVLVNRDGKIIQSKIRGAQLEKALENIFGY